MKGKQPGDGLRPVDWKRHGNLVPFEKNFYNATPNNRNMDPRIVEEYR